MSEVGLATGTALATGSGARSSRAAWMHLGAAWLATWFAPMAVLLLLPLAFGVPHVVNDLRLLAIRPPRAIQARFWLPLVGALAGITGLRVAAVLGLGRWPTLEVALGVALLVAAALCARGPRRRLTALCAAGLGSGALLAPQLAALLLAHAHNLVALLIWLGFFATRAIGRGERVAIAAAWAIGWVAFLVLPLPAALAGPLPPALGGLEFDGLRATLAPGLGADLGARLVLTFAFAQAMHYSVWVHLLPGAAANGGGWRVDLGRAGWIVALTASVGLPLVALADPAGARATYLSLVLFHGWLELAIVTHWIASGRRT